MGDVKDSRRDKIAVGLCNWILNHVASAHYRDMIKGAVRLGMITAAANDLDGKELLDLTESIQQMARGETTELEEEGPDENP